MVQDLHVHLKTVYLTGKRRKKGKGEILVGLDLHFRNSQNLVWMLELLQWKYTQLQFSDGSCCYCLICLLMMVTDCSEVGIAMIAPRTVIIKSQGKLSTVHHHRAAIFIQLHPNLQNHLHNLLYVKSSFDSIRCLRQSNKCTVNNWAKKME